MANYKIEDLPNLVGREFRDRHNMTQQALADALGVSKSAIQKYEAGNSAPAGLLLPLALKGLGK